MGTTLLMDRLDDELRSQFDLSLTEYEILVRLSEREGWQMRMAQLADALAHSRSRVTHTVKRMEQAKLRPAHDLPRGRPRRRGDDDPEGLRPAGAGGAGPRRGSPASTSSTSRAPRTSRALGRVMNDVADHLIGEHPEMEIR